VGEKISRKAAKALRGCVQEHALVAPLRKAPTFAIFFALSAPLRELLGKRE
jgi:hypothetical protein